MSRSLVQAILNMLIGKQLCLRSSALETGAMAAQWVKLVQYFHEDQGLNPQNTCKARHKA